MLKYNCNDEGSFILNTSNTLSEATATGAIDAKAVTIDLVTLPAEPA